jgi:hypothetical protein
MFRPLIQDCLILQIKIHLDDMHFLRPDDRRLITDDRRLITDVIGQKSDAKGKKVGGWEGEKVKRSANAYHLLPLNLYL